MDFYELIQAEQILRWYKYSVHSGYKCDERSQANGRITSKITVLLWRTSERRRSSGYVVLGGTRFLRTQLYRSGTFVPGI